MRRRRIGAFANAGFATIVTLELVNRSGGGATDRRCEWRWFAHTGGIAGIYMYVCRRGSLCAGYNWFIANWGGRGMHLYLGGMLLGGGDEALYRWFRRDGRVNG